MKQDVSILADAAYWLCLMQLYRRYQSPTLYVCLAYCGNLQATTSRSSAWKVEMLLIHNLGPWYFVAVSASCSSHFATMSTIPGSLVRITFLLATFKFVWAPFHAFITESNVESFKQVPLLNRRRLFEKNFPLSSD